VDISASRHARSHVPVPPSVDASDASESKLDAASTVPATPELGGVPPDPAAVPLLAPCPLDTGRLPDVLPPEEPPDELPDEADEIPPPPASPAPWPDCEPPPHAANAKSAKIDAEQQVVFMANYALAHPVAAGPSSVNSVLDTLDSRMME
jgi:hypothetical protein